MSQGLADRLKKLREQRDLSQAQLAEAVGVHQNHRRQFQKVERLPDSDEALVKTFLDAFLFKCKVEGLSAPERR